MDDIRRAEGRHALYAKLNTEALQLVEGTDPVPTAFEKALAPLRRLWEVARTRQASLETFLQPVSRA